MSNLKLITFGCQTNQLDSEKIAGLLAQEGFHLIEREEEADLILFNTCSIRKKAEEKFYSHLGKMRILKRRNPSLRIGVCGCVAEQEGEEIRRRFPFVDFVAGPGGIGEIPALLNIKGVPTRGRETLSPLRFDRVQAWVEIMKGCDNYCAYCVVPHLRGREESRPPEDVLGEIGGLLSQGYKEIVLLGHNVNSYGKGLNPSIDFPELLRRIEEKVKGSAWIRFTTSHPKDLTPQLARCLAELPSLCEHIHLPIQSGSDPILARMNRGYSRSHIITLITELRKWVPDIAITTDIMVGFPGEQEADFQATLNLLKEVRFDRIFSFKYSPRPQTSALSLPGHLNEEVKEDRLNRLIALQNRISLEKNQALLGKVMDVLVERKGSKKDAKLLTARTRTNHVVHFADSAVTEGWIFPVRIREASHFHLKGERIF